MGSRGIGGCASADGRRQTPPEEGGERIRRERGRGVTWRVRGVRKAWSLKRKSGTERTGRFVPFRSERLAVNNHKRIKVPRTWLDAGVAC